MKADINLGPTGAGSVRIDDIELSQYLHGFTLATDANDRRGGPARLYLDVASPQNVHFAGDVEIELPVELVQVLVHMGWTPPNAASPGPRTGSSAAGSVPPD
jgi:hypothetical protein